MLTGFVCERCGACCRNLREFGGLYADLDSGNGVCRFYDNETRLCTIYFIRPLKCRIAFSYRLCEKYYTWEEYLSLTRRGCELLRKK